MIGITLKDEDLLRILIAENGKSLREFSRDIGISQAYLSQILNGHCSPSAKVAHKIANGVGKKTTDLFLVKMIDKSIVSVSD